MNLIRQMSASYSRWAIIILFMINLGWIICTISRSRVNCDFLMFFIIDNLGFLHDPLTLIYGLFLVSRHSHKSRCIRQLEVRIENPSCPYRSQSQSLFWNWIERGVQYSGCLIRLEVLRVTESWCVFVICNRQHRLSEFVWWEKAHGLIHHTSLRLNLSSKVSSERFKAVS